MQGVFVLLFALSAVVLAQSDDGQGCCFYRKPGFEDEIYCTNEPFNISDLPKSRGKKLDGVKSFFCTEGFSAAILHNNRVEELIDCGDVVNETTSSIPTDLITVGGCLLRRCCFYSGKNKDGDEYCVNDASATSEELARVQANSNFVVAECVREWRASIVTHSNKKIEVACGETLDIPAPASKIQSIKLTACSVPAKAMSELEAVENTFEEMNVEDTFVDQSVGEVFSELAVADTDMAEENMDFDSSLESTDYATDEFVGEEQQQAADFAVSDSASQAVTDTMDNFDSTFAGDQLTDSFEGDAQAVSDEGSDMNFAVDPSFNLGDSVDEAVTQEETFHSTFADDSAYLNTFEQAAAVDEDALLDATLSDNEEEFAAAVGESVQSSATSFIVSAFVIVASVFVALF